jgi:hypothetical protein
MPEILVTYYSSHYILNHDHKRFTKNKGTSDLEDKMGFWGNKRKV